MATLVFLCGPRSGPGPSAWARASAMEMAERFVRKAHGRIVAYDSVNWHPPSTWASAPWPARYVVTYRTRGDPPSPP